MVARRLSDTPIDLRCLNCSPVGCMILALRGGVDPGWEAVWCGRIWRVRRIWSWSPGWCSCGREDAVLEAMLSGWRAQQTARGLCEDTIAPRERLVPPVRRVHQRVSVALAARARG